MTKGTKTLLLLGGIGLAYWWYKKKSASASMVNPVQRPGAAPAYIFPVGAPGGPVPMAPGMTQNTQTLFNTMQNWINQHPG